MTRVLFVCLAVLLSSCSSIIPTLPAPPASPAPVDVITEQKALGAYSGTPTDYLYTGVKLADTWCVAYLNALSQNAGQTDFYAATTTSVGAMASGIAGATGVGAPIPAIMGIIFPALNQTLIAQGRMATAGVDPGVVYGMIQKEHAAFLGALSAPATVAEATADVSSYSALCQPASIRSAILSAAVNASASVAPSRSGPGPVGVALPAAPVLHVPPVVTIQ